MTKKKIVGYDARELWLDIDSQWTDEKKQLYLLRHDVKKPLSVDNYIWYSVFSEKSTPRIWQNIPRKSTYQTVDWEQTFAENQMVALPDIYRPRRVWTSLDSLIQHLNSNWKDDWKPCAIIAIEEVFIEDEDECESVIIDPNAIDNNWKILGYDVADYELYTGLSDPAIDSKLSNQIRREWINKLNEYHLFLEPEIAFDYINFANIRNPTHRPFTVYGLYLVETRRVSSLT